MSNTCETFATPVEMCTNNAKYLVTSTGKTGVTTQSHSICPDHLERHVSGKLGRYLCIHITLADNNG